MECAVKLYATLLPLIVCTLLTLPTAFAYTKAQVAYGVDSNVDSLYTIDVRTGVITIVGPLGSGPERYTTPTSLAIRPSDGAMFASNNSPDMDRGISRLDPATGKATIVVPYDGAIQSIAFDARGQIIAQLQITGRLAVIDLETATVQQFGSYDLPILDSLATNPTNGQLYGLSSVTSSVEHLVQISSTGEITSTVDVMYSPPNGGGPIAFDSSGILHYIVSGGLFQLDPATGKYISERIPITFPYLPQGFAFSVSAQKSVPTLSNAGVLVLLLLLCATAFLSRQAARQLVFGRSG